MDANSGAPYELTSELAQFCLPAGQKEGSQTLAWVNSIALVYLLIGLIGLKPPAMVIRQIQPLEEPVVTVIEPPVATPTTLTQEEQQPEEQEPSDTSDAPQIVAVTLDSPAVNFSVPTVGNLLVSASVAQAPPPKPMQTVQAITNRIFNIRTTGRGGDFPQPDYPSWAIQEGMKGELVLLISVDPGGVVTDVQVEQSTGYSRLDRHTIAHVKRRFVFPTADEPKQYRLPLEYTPVR